MPGTTVVTMGEVLLRLSAPGRELLLQSPMLAASFGGAEANVAVALAHLGSRSRLVTILPVGVLGDAALSALSGAGVDTGHIVREHGRLGLYFVSPGASIRASEIVYDRANSVFARPDPAVIDWSTILGDARWLHVSGISLALGAAAEGRVRAAVMAARQLGVRISFDCNFRQQLWSARGIDPRPVIDEMLASADLAFADHRDYRLLTGIDLSNAEPGEVRRRTAAGLFERFPRLAYVAGVRRDVESHDCHMLSAAITCRDGREALAPDWRLAAVVDRIGGGDAFAAGLLHLIDRAPLEEAIAFAAAAGALKHTLPGDMLRANENMVRRALAGGADVRR